MKEDITNYSESLWVNYWRSKMIFEIVMWGFFSAWGWFGANYIKEQIWPPEPPTIEKKVEEKK